MNYGYASDPPLRLGREDEKNRYQVQLYDKIANSIPTPLQGVDMLEVGCGRGGGAQYISRQLQPRSLKGIDLCQAAVDFCQQNENSQLEFSQGDAMDIPFTDDIFGAVINIESSHRYPDMPKFLSEVKRVLIPGGYFSFTDFRATEATMQLQEQMNNSGMSILERKNITAEVIRALELDNARKLELIKRLVPRILHKPAREFASVIGSASYMSLKQGKRTYVRYLLQK
jgi:ubiquinone/menaquinone biosynthesis C-methylase UbiE